MSRLWVVAYDIGDDEVRTEVSGILKNHGVRVQYSVFECRLDRPALAALRREVETVIGDADSVRWYPLCAWCAGRVSWQGAGREPEDDRFYLL